MSTDKIINNGPIACILPAWSIRCRRCEEWIERRCDCEPLPDAVLGIAGPGARVHRATCTPTYASDGGALPDRCPECDAPRWLEAPRWRRGQSQHPRAIARRAAKAAKMRRRVR